MAIKAHTYSGNGESRRLQDHYSTPEWVTLGLLRHERFWGRVGEVACGEGYISKVLEDSGKFKNVFSSDKYKTVPVRKPEVTKEYMKELNRQKKAKEITEEQFLKLGFNMLPIYKYGFSGIDFANIDDKSLSVMPTDLDHIITNPPFCLFLEFVLQAKKYAAHKIAFFGKLNFLECQNRYEMWQDKVFPLKKVLILVDRVLFPGYDEVYPLGTAWYVWDRDYEGKPYFELMLKNGKVSGNEQIKFI